VGVKGRSCETRLAGEVGRIKLYFSVIRLWTRRARSWSGMSMALISWMRMRRWAMPSSAGSDSDMAVAFWPGVLPGGSCVEAVGGDGPSWRRRNGSARAWDGFADIWTGVSIGASSWLSSWSTTALRDCCGRNEIRRNRSIGTVGRVAEITSAVSSSRALPMLPRPSQCGGGIVILLESRLSHARDGRRLPSSLASPGRTAPENRRAWRTTGSIIKDDRRLIAACCVSTRKDERERRRRSSGVRGQKAFQPLLALCFSRPRFCG
jgi:hypothetical protein